MRYLVLDFETKDPYIDLKMGAGWVYPLHVPTSIFKVIGFSYLEITDIMNNEGTYLSNPTYLGLTELINGEIQHLGLLKSLISTADAVIMHNAQYDLGCLLALGIDITAITVLDTKVIAQLYDNTLPSYSLEPLSNTFLPEDQRKVKGSLGDVVKKHKLLRSPKGNECDPNASTYMERAIKWAYSNMDIIQELDFEAMAYYATQDVIATAHLFLHFTKECTLSECLYWSKFQKIMVKIRAKGIHVSITKIREGMALMEPEIERLKIEIANYIDYKAILIQWEDYDIDSPTKLSKVLIELGYKLPKTFAGGDSTNHDAIALLIEDNPDDTFLQLILDYREVNKIHKDFFVKVLDMQQYTCPEALVDGAEYGMVYPEMNLFGAKTGRFSSSCPNIQQIPKRSKKWGKLARGIFIPKEGMKWYSLDWSNQEGRLAVHYAKLINAPKIDELVNEWRENPAMDMHQKVADLVGIERTPAKVINLGLMYYMGEGKLCKKLKLPTVTVQTRHGMKERAGVEGKALLNAYHTYVPFVKYINKICMEQITLNGHIQTLLKRKLKNEPGREYKALNKLIQGSAADQCLAVLLAADMLGLDIICLVHDEFNIQGNIGDASMMKSLMEHHILFEVPMLAEVSVGDSWGTLEDIK